MTTKISRVTWRLPAVLAVSLMVACGDGDPATHIEKAKRYIDGGERSAAVIELKNVLVKDPQHAEARYLLGVMHHELGDFASAEKELRRAIELHHDPAKSVPALGRALLMAGEFQKVLDDVPVPSGAADAVRADVLTLRGLASLALNRTGEGRTLLDQALALQPEQPEALLGYARIAVMEKSYDAALRFVDRAVRSAPGNTEAWLIKGDLSRMRDDRAGAAAAYREVLSLRPDNTSARTNLAMLEAERGDFKSARAHLAEARGKRPGDATIHYAQAVVELRAGDFRSARESVQKLLQATPDHTPALLVAGAVEYALGAYEQAQTYLRRVVRDAPANVYARKLLVSSMARAGQWQPALEVLQPALKAAPADSKLLALAGELHLQGQQLSTAARYFELAVARDPADAATRAKLGMTRLGLGQTDRALADLEAAVQLNPADEHTELALVTFHVRRNNYDEALKAMGRLESRQPDNPRTYNLKAGIYTAKQDFASARSNLERALQLRASYVPAAMNLAQLDLRDQHPQAARARLETILKSNKDDVQALLGLARLGPEIGATRKERIEWLQRAAKAAPSLLEPQLMLAQVYIEGGDARMALDTAEQARARHPDVPAVLEILGEAQLAAGRKEQAVATYDRLAALQPGSARALFRVATAQSATGGHDEAAATLRKALAVQPDFMEAQVALAQLHVRAGRYPEALRIARELQGKPASRHPGLVLEGDVLHAQGRSADAAAVYERAASIMRSSVVAVKLHAAYSRGGKPEEADARLAQWLSEFPNDGYVRLYTAETSLKTGRIREAIAQYELLQKDDPDNVQVLNNLAWAYQQVKDARALATAERAYGLTPNNAASADTYGWILVEQNKTRQALDVLQQAVAAAPDVPTIRYHLAYAAFKAGDRLRARTELQRVLTGGAGFPEREDAQRLMKQLTN